MHKYHIPVFARFQWLNHELVINVISKLLVYKGRGRKGYDKVYMFRLLVYKQLMSCSYRDLESISGIDYSTFIKFKQRLIHLTWFAKVFKALTKPIGKNLKELNLILDSSFVQTYSKHQEHGSEYSGYMEKNGFKLHQIIEFNTRLPLLQNTTGGARSDPKEGEKLIRAGPKDWKVRSLTADKGYDSGNLVLKAKQKWRFCKVAIPLRKTNQKLTWEEQKRTYNYHQKAKDRCLDPKLINQRTEIERYFSRKKRVMNLGEERTRGLKNFQVNCYMTSIMEILEFLASPDPQIVNIHLAQR
jgi:hypothetical protein